MIDYLYKNMSNELLKYLPGKHVVRFCDAKDAQCVTPHTSHIRGSKTSVRFFSRARIYLGSRGW